MFGSPKNLFEKYLGTKYYGNNNDPKLKNIFNNTIKLSHVKELKRIINGLNIKKNKSTNEKIALELMRRKMIHVLIKNTENNNNIDTTMKNTLNGLPPKYFRYKKIYLKKV